MANNNILQLGTDKIVTLGGLNKFWELAKSYTNDYAKTYTDTVVGKFTNGTPGSGLCSQIETRDAATLAAAKTYADGKDAAIADAKKAGTDAAAAAAKALTDAKAYADGKDAAIADAKKAGTDAAAALNTYKTEVSNTYVAKVNGKGLSTEDYTTEEKTKLAGIAAGAEVNYINDVGDNLNVVNGKLTVTIPEVEVPFQTVANGDKVLTLADGVLSSTLSYARENINGVDSLVLRGIGNEVIGSVPVADFIADGMLESVTPEEGTNKFIFTFKTGNDTTESFKVDFSKYVDTYNADGETIELGANNTFKVKSGVFAAASTLADAKTYVDNRFTNEVTGKFDTVGSAAKALTDAKSYADGKFQVAGNYETAGAAATVKSELLGTTKEGDVTTIAALNTKIENVDDKFDTIIVASDAEIEAIVK